MTTRWFSLRRRLLSLLLGGVAVAWVITIIFSFLDARHEIDDLFDAQLVNSAQTLMALTRHELDEGHLDGQIEDIAGEGHKYERRLRFQIRNEQGQLVLRSNLTPPEVSTAITGFSETHDADGSWHHFGMWNQDHNLHVQVSENSHARNELVQHITFRLLFPALFGLPLIGLWVWLATQRGLSTLNDIASQIASRDPQQLASITPATAPEELRPMLDALNALFQRVETTLQAERRFTADAAHELRTPLAALQAQLQVAQRARNDEEREHSLNQLQGGLHRAAHLIEQMLQLARLDPESGLPAAQPVNLASLAESVCAELGNAIFEKHLDFELNATPDSEVTGQPEWLRVLIRNLVDNAIRYSPTGGQIRVSLKRMENACQLLVSDNGPGIPPAEYEQVLRRFHRLNHGIQGGCGLGLSIVSRIAELHGAQLALEAAAEGGLAVKVTFPV